MKPTKIMILNGPNLNLLGKREPHIYGDESFEIFFDRLQQEFSVCELSYFQSNHEGALIDKLHEVGFIYSGIIFNPAGYTHTSVALRDAIAAIDTPVIEVHISNPALRESFRQHSFIAAVCTESVVGMGLEGYKVAVEKFLQSFKE